MNAEDLCYTPATELVRLIRAKALSPVEVTDAVLARMESVNPKINAFCTPTPDLAREAAQVAEHAVMRGEPLAPLHGVPYTVKDLVITKGIRTMRGSAIHENDVPDEDAPVVSRLKAAGGIMLGKTTTPEFGWKGMTDSPVTGVTRNPWNLDKTPGGSSGGASAQVAAGIGPLAVGTDGGGSIRIPAGFTGIYGLKPTYGRVPVYPASPFDTLSHVGPMTRTVGDAALMLSVIAGHHPGDRYSQVAPPADYLGRLRDGIRGMKVVWSPDLGYAKVHPEVAQLAKVAARAFADLDCHFEEIGDPGFGDPTETFGVHWFAGCAGMLGEALENWGDQMDPGLVEMVERGLSLSAKEYAQAQTARSQYHDRVRRFFEHYHLLLTPALAVLPFKAGATYQEALAEEEQDWMNWTPFSYPFNLTGMPAAVVPAGFSASGLPVALQIVAPRGEDLRVLQASAAYEAVRPWADRRPPL